MYDAGLKVPLLHDRLELGTVTRIYDCPSATKLYPSGYPHDLSLISDPALPDVTNSPGYLVGQTTLLPLSSRMYMLFAIRLMLGGGDALQE